MRWNCDGGRMSAPARPRVAVVGAGIAGLAAAQHLLGRRPDLEVVVLEGADRVGGKLLRGEVAGVQVDLGAESLLARRPEAIDLVRAAGLGDDLVHPHATTASIWSRGSLRPMPPTVFGIPSDIAAADDARILSPRGVLRLRASLLDRRRLREPGSPDVSVGDLVSRAVGTEVLDRLVEPLLGGVYAGHARELSLRAAAPQIAALAEEGGSLVAAAARRRGSDSAAGPVFAGVVGGVARLPEALASALPDVRLHTPVRRIAPLADGYALELGSAAAPSRLTVGAVLLATPAAPTARLLAELAPHAAAELRQVEHASMAVVSLAVPSETFAQPLAGSGFLVPPVDGRTVKAATWSSSKWAWIGEAAGPDTVILRASLGRHREEAVLQRDDAELVDLAVADLRAAVGMHGPLLDAVVTRWGGALPQYSVGHAERMSRVRAAVADVDALEVCGAAYEGLGVAACVAGAQQAADRLLTSLPTRDLRYEGQ
jgi:oxygen-dependent protoporphyrinogen oxidase